MPEKMNCTKTIKYDGIVRVLNKVVDLAEPLPLEQGLRLKRFLYKAINLRVSQSHFH